MNPGELERTFINQYQGGFPVLEQPFRMVAADLGCSENTLLGSIRHLLDTGLLSRFGPLYDAVKLGGGLTLAAMSVPAEDIECVARIVSAFPEVNHNYEREHEFNLWFVLTAPDTVHLQQVIDSIGFETGYQVMNLPMLEDYFIDLGFNIQWK